METKKKRNQRAPYLAPQIEVIAVENEGSVMVVSGPNSGNGGHYPTSSTSSRSSISRPSTATSSDLEDLINDILTVEQ